MKTFFSFGILCLCVLYSELTNAQFEFFGQFRPRTEFRNGYRVLPDSTSLPAFVTSQQSRIGFKYNHQKFNTCMSIQDVRIWGEVKNKTDIASINVHEAWFEWFCSDKINLKIGRQALKYDDERLLSMNNWNNVNSAHDLLLLKYKSKKTQAHMGFAYNNNSDVYFESNYSLSYYKTLSFIWMEKKLNDYFRASCIAIADGNENKDDYRIIYLRGTYGANLNYKNDSVGLNVTGSAYYQNGKNDDGTKISAYLYHLKAEYELFKNISFFVAYDYFSGNDYCDTNLNMNHAFNNLYGAGHRFLGYMDYYTDIEKSTAGAGLTDLYGALSYEINKKWENQLAFHWFNTTGQLRDPEITNSLIALDKNLGYETDLTIDYKFNDNLKFKAGYSVYFATRTLEILKGGDKDMFLNWAYIMLTITM
ncbi:MAG: alginate export family protein [Marinilabiliales bacterium]